MEVALPENDTLPLSDSVHFQQCLGEDASPTLLTLEDSGHQQSARLESDLNYGYNTGYLSSCTDETLEGRSDSEQKDDTEPPESNLSESCLPGRTVENTKPSESDWPEQCPDGGARSASGWSGWVPHDESEINLSVSVSSVCFSDDKPSMVGAGLANLGNTCFLNAVLQCFIHTVPLVQGLRSCNHPFTCHDEGFCVLCNLRGLVELSLASTGRVLSPHKLVDNLSYFAPSFWRFQQEDAHEFLQCFLDRLDNSCTGSKANHGILSLQNDNIVKNVFGGRLVSKLRCCNCGHCSDTYEPLIDLSLEIDNVATLPAALESFTKVEVIEDKETKFTCEQCNEAVLVEKQLILDQAPAIVALHLKRFKNDGSFVEKIDKHVEFPLELDLLPFSSDSQDNDVGLKYDLYAVVVHTGFSSTSGHYCCFIRSSPDTWYKFDDSKVIRVREGFVLSQEAYILFYSKQGTIWFSSFMETEKLSIDANIFHTSPKSVLDNVDCIRILSPGVTNTDDCAINDTDNTANKITIQTPSGLRDLSHDGAETSVSEKVLHRAYIPSSAAGNSDKSSHVEQVFSPSVLEEKYKNDELNDNANFTPLTPLRSPSPDIYKESPERCFSIARDHLHSVDQVPCKSELSKDPQIKEARRLLRSMPSSRSRKLLAALPGSASEGSGNKKRSRTTALSPDTVNHFSNGARKSQLDPIMRSLASGSFR